MYSMEERLLRQYFEEDEKVKEFVRNVERSK